MAGNGYSHCGVRVKVMCGSTEQLPNGCWSALADHQSMPAKVVSCISQAASHIMVGTETE